jgi:DNA-binding IclR family transcriptional regulator
VLAALLNSVPKPRRSEVRQGIEQAREDYRQHGFVFSLGDWMPELYAVGVPLPIIGGERVLALSVSGPLYAMTRERLVGEVGPALMRARDRVLARLG